MCFSGMGCSKFSRILPCVSPSSFVRRLLGVAPSASCVCGRWRGARRARPPLRPPSSRRRARSVVSSFESYRALVSSRRSSNAPRSERQRAAHAAAHTNATRPVGGGRRRRRRSSSSFPPRLSSSAGPLKYISLSLSLSLSLPRRADVAPRSLRDDRRVRADVTPRPPPRRPRGATTRPTEQSYVAQLEKHFDKFVKAEGFADSEACFEKIQTVVEADKVRCCGARAVDLPCTPRSTSLITPRAVDLFPTTSCARVQSRRHAYAPRARRATPAPSLRKREKRQTDKKHHNISSSSRAVRGAARGGPAAADRVPPLRRGPQIRHREAEGPSV